MGLSSGSQDVVTNTGKDQRDGRPNEKNEQRTWFTSKNIGIGNVDFRIIIDIAASNKNQQHRHLYYQF